MPSAIPIASPNGIAARTIAGLPDARGALVRLFDRPAVSLPGPDASVGDVNDLPRAVTQQERRGDCASLSGGADDRNRLIGLDALRDPVDGVVWRVNGAGDMALIPFGALAHIQHLNVVNAISQGAHVDALQRSGGSLLLAPAGHATGEVAGDVADPYRRSEVRGVDRVGVVAADEHDRSVAVGDPRELGTEP